MKTAGIILAAWAYTFGSWGYILIKGYNITFKQWVDPFHPWDGQWPPKCVPPGYLFPTTASPGVDCTPKTPGLSPQQKAGRHALQTQPNPHGFVQ